MPFTFAQKLEALEREITIRLRVYPGRVMNHRMTQRLADYELAIMRAIADDYRELAKKEQLL